MKPFRVWASLPVLAVVALAAPAVAQRYEVAGSEVAIYNLAGEVAIEAGTGSATTVMVTRGGSEASQLKIQNDVVDGRPSLKIMYPSDRIVYPPLGHGSRTQLRVRSDGTFGRHGDDWSGRKVTISGSGSGLEAHADLRISIPRGKDVIVRNAAGDVRVTNVDAKLFVDVATSDVTASGTKGELSIDTGSGSVKVSNAKGRVDIDTGSGNVDVSQIVGDELMVDTGSGSVEGSQLEAERLSVDTGSGDVELTGVRSTNVHVDTGSGSVEVGLLTDIETLSIDTGSGDATVELPATAGAMLALETGSGDVDVSAPLTKVHRGDGELHAQLGDGKGSITVETGSGSIRIDHKP